MGKVLLSFLALLFLVAFRPLLSLSEFGFNTVEGHSHPKAVSVSPLTFIFVVVIFVCRWLRLVSRLQLSFCKAEVFVPLPECFLSLEFLALAIFLCHTRQASQKRLCLFDFPKFLFSLGVSNMLFFLFLFESAQLKLPKSLFLLLLQISDLYKFRLLRTQ